jgi:hypothetical protein
MRRRRRTPEVAEEEIVAATESLADTLTTIWTRVPYGE